MPPGAGVTPSGEMGWVDMKRFGLPLILLLLTLLVTACTAEMEAPCPTEQSYCVSCHSDKAMLIANTAPAEPETAPEEAAGEG